MIRLRFTSVSRARAFKSLRKRESVGISRIGSVFLAVAAFLIVLATSLSAAAQTENLEDLQARVALAQEMVVYLPVAPQVETAVSRYVDTSLANYSADQREIIRKALLNVMNPLALEQKAVDAYAQVYTREELQAMVDYYASPEAQSARKKQDNFNALIRPEIFKMLDEAVMRLRSVGEGG